MIRKDDILNEFKKMILKIQFEFLENELFLPIGLELSVVPIILETKEDYSFKGIEDNNEIDKVNYPLAYYKPDTDSIHIFIEHNAFLVRKSITEQYSLLMFLLFHEASHRLLMHIPRQNNREMELWNIASDYEIHNTYYVYDQIIQTNKKLQNNQIYKIMKNHITKFLIIKDDEKFELGLFEKEFLNNTAEEIYHILLNSKIEESFDFKFENGNATVKISKYKLPNGKSITTTNVLFPENLFSNKSKETLENEKNNALTRKTLMQNTILDQLKKMKGNSLNKINEFLKKLFNVKIDWKKILRNSLAVALEKDCLFSWSRPRISMFGLKNGPYLPSQIEDNSAYGTLIVARDESGSMSDNELRKAASIIADAKEHYKSIIVLKHDTEISSINEFEDLNDNAINMLLTRTSDGGTSHKKIFEWINNYEKNNDNKISCCIFITDMYSDIEDYQDIINKNIPIIYLSNTKSIEYYKSKIKGILIPIE